MPKIEYIDDPNIIIPLAASFNQRGLLGYTQAITNADDQLKINSVYEPIVNSATNKATLYLTKRPGVTDYGFSWGTSTQTAYLAEVASEDNSATSGDFNVVYTNGNDIQVANAGVSTLVTTVANMLPAFIDKRRLGGTEYIVVQLRRKASGGVNIQRAYIADFVANGFFENTLPTNNIVGKMEFLDGYAFLQEGFADGKIYNTGVNSSTWAAIDWIQRQIKNDEAAGLARLGKQIISFGTASMEVYRNAGTPFGSPLEIVPSLTQEYGMPLPVIDGQRHYYTVVGPNLYWRGNPTGIYAYNGQGVQKVSSPAIDKILSERTHYFVGRISFNGQEAVVIGLDLVTAATQNSLLFFPAWKEWFIWQSTVFIPQTTSRRDGFCLGTAGNQHKLYVISTSSNTFQDAGTDYTWTHQFRMRKSGNGRTKMDMFGLVGDTASSAMDIGVQFSDDDYATFSSTRTIDMMSHKKSITRCGAYYTPRVVKLTYTGSQAPRLEAALARVS